MKLLSLSVCLSVSLSSLPSSSRPHSPTKGRGKLSFLVSNVSLSLSLSNAEAHDRLEFARVVRRHPFGNQRTLHHGPSASDRYMSVCVCMRSTGGYYVLLPAFVRYPIKAADRLCLCGCRCRGAHCHAHPWRSRRARGENLQKGAPLRANSNPPKKTFVAAAEREIERESL